MNLLLSFALFEKFKAFILRGPWNTEFYFEWRKGGNFGEFGAFRILLIIRVLDGFYFSLIFFKKMKNAFRVWTKGVFTEGDYFFTPITHPYLFHKQPPLNVAI